VFVPHWNNNEGGEKHDTSRCYMGQPRFAELMDQLPQETTVVGIDEHTALIIDPERGACRVLGAGGVTILRDGGERRYVNGETVDCDDLGPFEPPDSRIDIPEQVWDMVAQAEQAQAAALTPSTEVLSLVEQRNAARMAKDWATSDRLRDQIAELGWQVKDTPAGAELTPVSR
jgi:hypothetical protein